LQRRRVLADTSAGPTMFNNVLAWGPEGVAATMQMQPTPRSGGICKTLFWSGLSERCSTLLVKKKKWKWVKDGKN